MKKKTNEKGITLIALVITIVILIILATISVNIVMNGGLIDRTSKGKELHELERERERLELIKGEVASDTNHVGKVTVDTYVEELIHKGITTEDETIDNGDETKTVITDTGYSVTIEPKGDKDVEIIIDGKVGELPPKIKNIKLMRNDEKNKLTIEVDMFRALDTTYQYYIKINDEDYSDKAYSSTETTYIISDISSSDIYTIKVKATNQYGSVEKEVSEPLPIEQVKREKYIKVKCGDGIERVCIVMYDKEDGELIQVGTLQPVEMLTLGKNGSTKQDAQVGVEQFNNIGTILQTVADPYFDSDVMTRIRPMYASWDSSKWIKKQSHSRSNPTYQVMKIEGLEYIADDDERIYGKKGVTTKEIWCSATCTERWQDNMAKSPIICYKIGRIHVNSRSADGNNVARDYSAYQGSEMWSSYSYTKGVCIVMELKSNLKIKEGNGTLENPYIIDYNT